MLAIHGTNQQSIRDSTYPCLHLCVHTNLSFTLYLAHGWASPCVSLILYYYFMRNGLCTAMALMEANMMAISARVFNEFLWELFLLIFWFLWTFADAFLWTFANAFSVDMGRGLSIIIDLILNSPYWLVCHGMRNRLVNSKHRHWEITWLIVLNTNLIVLNFIHLESGFSHAINKLRILNNLPWSFIQILRFLLWGYIFTDFNICINLYFFIWSIWNHSITLFLVNCILDY